MTSPPITVSLTAAPLPTSVVPGVNAVGTPADASVGVVAPEGLEDPRKSEQEQGMLLASPTGLKDTLKSEQEQSQLVVVVASEGLKDTRKSEQDQGKFKLKAFPVGLKDTRKSVQEQSKSVVGVAPEGLEDTRKSEQEQGKLKASPVGLKDTLKSVQEQSQLVVGVAPEGLKDTRKSEQEQGMLLASPASLKDTLKSEHVEDSATGATGAFAALARTDVPTPMKAAIRESSTATSGMFWKSHIADPMQVVKEKRRELGPWTPRERTEQQLGWLTSFVVSEVVVATHKIISM